MANNIKISAVIVKGEFLRDSKIKFVAYYGYYPVINGETGFFVCESKEQGITDEPVKDEYQHFADKFARIFDKISVNID